VLSTSAILEFQIPQVLRDDGRRASYDSLRRGLGGLGAQGPYSPSSAWRPGADDFEEAFASWFERQGYAYSNHLTALPLVFGAGSIPVSALVAACAAW
jgi:curved DNA-binding protein CbpA